MTDHGPAFAHPEWVNGRRLWMDTPMRDLIDRVRFGDPVKGWEGDPRLEVYWNGIDERFELWRCEDDEQYRLVARSAPGIPFDERVIDALIGMDGRRRQSPLHESIIKHNTELDARRDAARDEWVAEDLAPRLRHAFLKDGV
jgi:hypothetical protein